MILATVGISRHFTGVKRMIYLRRKDTKRDVDWSNDMSDKITKHYNMSFSQQLIKEPLLYNLGLKFGIEFSKKTSKRTAKNVQVLPPGTLNISTKADKNGTIKVRVVVDVLRASNATNMRFHNELLLFSLSLSLDFF